MRVLWSWLLELCDLDRQITPEQGAAALTRGGLEIEGIEALGTGFSGVVVAEVVAKRPHPDAAKLTLVDVITERGGAATQVVCGASNVPEPGLKVLWAQIGATLPGNITLAAKPVKGIVSPGMLCAEDELGLGDDHAGIVVLEAGDPTPLGAPAQHALGLADHVLELSAPANRGDVLGLFGVARELVAVLGGCVVPPDAELAGFLSAGGAPTKIDIADPALCARYTARVIEGVTVAPSPRRIAQRLRAVGVRAISNLVDVTNYVLFELGQPLHAFDANTLKAGTIRVTAARDTESLVTLDGAQRALVPGDIVIRDGDRIVALAGVMGGRDTEVTAGTTRVLLESASFQPLAIRRTAKRLALPSEASLRFSRGVDPELAAFASARAARLLCQLAGGRIAGELADAYPAKRAVAPVHVRLPRVKLITGVALDANACTGALERLGCAVSPAGDGLAVTPPSWRVDLTREVDMIEEILRISGYEQVQSTLPALRQAPGIHDADRADLARHALAAAGALEAITYGFQSAERANALGLPGSDRRSQPIAIKNPMSGEQAVMRTSLVPNLGAAIARNQSFGRRDVCLFEVGSVFLKRGEGATERPMHELADEPVWAAGVLAGKRRGRIGDGAPYDAFDAKALALEAIRAVAGTLDVRTEVAAVPYLHPGVAGALVVDRSALTSDIDVPTIGSRGIVGWFGELHPDVRARLGIDGPAFAFEVHLDALPLAPPPAMQAIPKYPGSDRDVSLLLAESIPAARVEQVIDDAAEPLVAGIRLLEDYRDAKLGAGNKSMLWSIAYRSPERTLTVAEVDHAHERIVRRLVAELPAQQR
ncbi:MAG TPA: phenylalanine--tRNA ligase subunit beta [Kofleriaceae bacterium]|jgi:phenylalanyl-tRNA synthetase beta chain